MPRKPRPAVHSPAGSFAPCFPTLDEDPASRRLEGWIADEDEHDQLAHRLEDEGRVVLVLGTPSQASVDLLAASLSSSSLLVLPPSTSPVASSSKSVVHLHADASPAGIGKAFEEALTVAAKWRKGKGKETKRAAFPSSPGASDRRRGSVLGLVGPAEQADGANTLPGWTRPKSQLSRPASMMSFASNSTFLSTAGGGGQRSQGTIRPPSSRPIDVVLHFLPSPPVKDPNSLQTLLSASFLVTTVALPVLAGNKSGPRDTSQPPPPSPNRPRPTSKLAPSSSSQSIRRPSESSLRQPINLFAPPIGTSASTPSSPVSKTRALSRPASVFSSSEFGSQSSEGMLVHILPNHAPPLLPMLLDKFMKPTLAPYSEKVGMVLLPESILGERPFVFRDNAGAGEREDTEEEDQEGLGVMASPSGSASSHASTSSRQHLPSRSFAATPPTILSLLLASSLRPPLVIPRAMVPTPRRGSATSTSSFRSSSLNPSTNSTTPTSSSGAAALLDVPTFIPSSTAVTYIPHIEAHPHPSSSSSLADDALGLSMTPSDRTSGGDKGEETPKLERSESVSESDGGGLGTPRGSVELKEVVGVVGEGRSPLGATTPTKKSGGGGGGNWFTNLFSSGGKARGKKIKSGTIAAGRA